MERIGNDEWTMHGVKSTFKILVSNCRPDGLQGLSYTAVCGLGWRFAISSGGSPGLRTHTSTRAVEIFFDPNRLRDANFKGLLSIGVQVMQTTLGKSNKWQALNLKLPTSGIPSSLGSYSILPGNRTDALIFTITVSFLDVGHSFPQHTLPRVRRVLHRSLGGGQFVDTKFYLFSRRLMPSGRATHPRALFANSSLLQGRSSYLDILLFGAGFKESTVVDLDTDSPPEMNASEYDYESDSDLGSEPDSNFEQCPSDSTSQGVSSSPMNPTKEPTLSPRDENTGENTDKGPDQQMECTTVLGDSVSNVSPPQQTAPPCFVVDDQQHTGEHTSRPPRDSRRTGRILVISDMAFTTWKALVFYSYTGEVVFSPLKSEGSKLKDGLLATDDGATPACSPKSMYRLADKLGLGSLQDFAFNEIRSRLSENNIVAEIHHSGISRYKRWKRISCARITTTPQ